MHNNRLLVKDENFDNSSQQAIPDAIVWAIESNEILFPHFLNKNIKPHISSFFFNIVFYQKGNIITISAKIIIYLNLPVNAFFWLMFSLYDSISLWSSDLTAFSL